MLYRVMSALDAVMVIAIVLGVVCAIELTGLWVLGRILRCLS